MKIFIALLCFLFLAASFANAHPPSDVVITFDPASKILTAVIVHNVSNPANHFIRKVDVSMNGKEVINHFISKQDNNETQTVMYLLPDAKANDLVSVEAYCSISGKLEKLITIPK
jgi:hypothetical protein